MKKTRKVLSLLAACVLSLGMLSGSYEAAVYDQTGAAGPPLSEDPAVSQPIYPGDSIANVNAYTDAAGTPISPNAVLDDGVTPCWKNQTGTVYSASVSAVVSQPVVEPVPEQTPAIDPATGQMIQAIDPATGMPIFDESGNPVYQDVNGAPIYPVAPAEPAPAEKTTTCVISVQGGTLEVIGGTLTGGNTDYHPVELNGIRYSYTGSDGAQVFVAAGDGNTSAAAFGIGETTTITAGTPAEGEQFQKWMVYTVDAANNLTPADDGQVAAMIPGFSAESLTQSSINVPVADFGSRIVFRAVYEAIPEPVIPAPEISEGENTAGEGQEVPAGDKTAGEGQEIPAGENTPVVENTSGTGQETLSGESALGTGQETPAGENTPGTGQETPAGENPIILQNPDQLAIEAQQTLGHKLTLTEDASCELQDLESILPGTEVTVTAVEKPDMVLTGWFIDGAEIDDTQRTQPQITFTMGESDVTVIPQYAIKLTASHNITVENATVEATDSSAGAVELTDNGDGSKSAAIEEGTVLQVTADQAPEGEYFEKWEVSSQGEVSTSSVTEPALQLTMGTSDVLVTPVYAAAEYTLTVNSGSESGDGNGTHKAGDKVTVKADDAPAGQHFSKWTVEGAGTLEADTAAETTFTMAAENATLTANYEEDLYKLTVQSGSESGGGDGTHKAGDKVTIKANDAPAGQSFTKWTVEGAGTLESDTAAETTFTMAAADATVTANYEAVLYKLTVQSGSESGGGNGSYKAGDKVTIKANDAPTGYRFTKWTVEGQGTLESETAAETTFTMAAADATVTANYEQITYKLTIQSGSESGGGNGSYKAGDKVPIKANAPQAGYYFTKWTVTGGGTFDSETAAETFFTMPASDVTITANFDAVVHILTVNSGSGGGSYKPGERVTIVANAAGTGYRFTKWTVAGNGTLESDTAAQTTFTIGDSDATVTANYEQIPYQLVVNSGSGSGTHYNGEPVVITANTPKSGYRFRSWTISSGKGTIASPTASQTTFTMTTSDAVVTANYELISYTLKIKNGSGSGSYTKGTSVDISPNYPPSGKEFDYWEKASGKISIDDKSSFYTSVTMKASDATVTAVYKDGPNPNNNAITGLENGAEYLKSTTLSFTAVGAGMDNGNPNPGDYRYRPSGYQIGSVGGSWTASPYTTSMAINAAGDYTLTVTYAKDVYDGSTWAPDGTTVSKSITFHVVNALSVKTGDNSPLMPLMIAGAAALAAIIVLVIVLMKRRKK